MYLCTRDKGKKVGFCSDLLEGHYEYYRLPNLQKQDEKLPSSENNVKLIVFERGTLNRKTGFQISISNYLFLASHLKAVGL